MRNKHKKLRFGIPTSHTVFVELLKVFARLSLHTRWPNDVAAVVPQLREVICEQFSRLRSRGVSVNTQHPPDDG